MNAITKFFHELHVKRVEKRKTAVVTVATTGYSFVARGDAAMRAAYRTWW